MPRQVPRRFTRASVVPPDPDLIPFDPRKAEIGHPRRSAAAELDSGDPAPPPLPPSILNHPIRNQRIRLHPAYLFILAHSIAIQRPRAVDHDRFRSAVVVLLKTPPCFLLSTRSPPLLKNNCGLAQFLASKPLDFYLLEPAVQILSFCTLALRFNR